MSSVFEKNINALRNKNPELVNRLLTHLPADVPQLVRENNSYNLTYKGKYLHNPANPLMEAAEIFAMAENSPVAIHIVYGIGLGYLFQVTSAKSHNDAIMSLNFSSFISLYASVVRRNGEFFIFDFL